MAVQNSLIEPKQKLGITAYLTQDVVKARINKVVGEKNAIRFISSIISAVQINPALQECSNLSILNAALLGEALNLSPSPQLGQFYMVPYNVQVKDANGNKVWKCDAMGNRMKDMKGNWIPETTREAQFQLGYKGYVQLAMRSGYYKKMNVLSIKEGELEFYNPLDEELKVTLIEDEEIRETASTSGYYAMFEYVNGFKKSIYWSKKKMQFHADKYSAAYSLKAHEELLAGNIDEKDKWKYSSFWYKDFDTMAYKTMLRQLISKWGIMSIEMQNAVEKDMAVIHEERIDYVDACHDTVILDSVDYSDNNKEVESESIFKESEKKEDVKRSEEEIQRNFFL